ncbi:MAG: sulfate transporter CysZ [Pseudomonadota bacterium]
MFCGIGYFFKGLRLIFAPGIKRYVIIPLIINITLFSFGLWVGITWFDSFLEKVLPGWLTWAEFILWPLFAISYFLIVFYAFAILVNVIAAPFNGFLAEKIESYLQEDKNLTTESSFQSVLKETPGIILSELSKLTYFLIRALPLLILFLIPGINVLAPFIWFIFSAWMLSLEYLDYPLGNHGILFKETRTMAKQRRTRCLSFGSVVSAFTLVPFLNFIAMPAAVAGATALYVDTFSENAKVIQK